jgi:glycerophosphoryl diester phosphodiesterase
MAHPAVSFTRPLVYAHRGGSALAPENTLPAFDNGVKLGADGLELDVHLSRDGVAVVHHDATLDRTTDAHGPIADRTAGELERVDAAAGFAGDGSYPFRGRGIGVPMLRTVLSRYRDTRFIIEIKNSSAALADAVLDELRRANAVDRACVGAFQTAGLRRLRQHEPSLATSASLEEVRLALYGSWVGWPIRSRSYAAFQVPERHGTTTVVSPRFIRAAHRGGLVVQVWTVDELEDMRRLLEWGADALITDRPDRAVQLIREHTRERMH